MKPQSDNTPRGPASADPRTLLRHTIARRLVSVVFQPIVDLQEGDVAAFEALCRPQPESGFADAGALFDAAERLGMLWELEEVTRSLALDAASSWSGGVLLFLNCSPQVFADPRFAASLTRALGAAPGLNPAQVVLEITERSDQQYVQGLAEQVRLLRGAQFQIAIDDVGAGTSGLNRIMSLRPQWLKLDRELVESIQRDRVRQNLIRFFVHFARLSGTRVVAEGIEREEELATLIDLGVHFGQGYYLGRPGSRDQTLEGEKAAWMRDRSARAEFDVPSRTAANRIGRFARPVLTASTTSSVTETAAALAREPHALGAAIVEGRRFIGWCDRESILARTDGECRVGSLPRRGLTPIAPDATVAEALDLVASRDDQTIADPIVVGRGGQVTGVLFLRDLMAAAAELGRNFHSWTTPLTGLPGRVRADQHVKRLIALATRTKPGEPRSAPRPADAAIIDIQRLADYNVAYGYDLGDRLIQDLAALLETTVVCAEESVFLAHLGDDRFLVTAPSGVIAERAGPLAAQFERALHTYCDGLITGGAAPFAIGAEPAEPGASSADDQHIGLRVILLPDAFSWVREPRDLYRLEHMVRHSPVGNGLESRAVAGGHILVAGRERLQALHRGGSAPLRIEREAA